jgi:hypothetical protein
MSQTNTVSPLRQRMLEDMAAPSSTHKERRHLTGAATKPPTPKPQPL